jgi:hypothetical protein
MSERRNKTIGFMMSAVLILLILGSSVGTVKAAAMYQVQDLGPIDLYNGQTTLNLLTNPDLPFFNNQAQYPLPPLPSQASFYNVLVSNSHREVIGNYALGPFTQQFPVPFGSGDRAFVSYFNQSNLSQFPNATTTFIPFPNLNDMNNSYSTAINNNGAVVGMVGSELYSAPIHGFPSTLSGYQGFIYENSKTSILDDLLPKDFASTVSVTEPIAISDSGMILAYGVDHSGQLGYTGAPGPQGYNLLVLTPVQTPEPSTLIIFSLISGSIVIKRIKRREEHRRPNNRHPTFGSPK